MRGVPTALGSMRGVPRVWGSLREISTVWGQSGGGDPYTSGSREGDPCRLGSPRPSRSDEPSPHRLNFGGPPVPPHPHRPHLLSARRPRLSPDERRRAAAGAPSGGARAALRRARRRRRQLKDRPPALRPAPVPDAATSPRLLTPDIGLQGRHAAAHGHGTERQEAARPLRRHRPAPRRHLGTGAGRAAAILRGEAAGGHLGEVKAGKGEQGNGGHGGPGIGSLRGAPRSERSRRLRGAARRKARGML